LGIAIGPNTGFWVSANGSDLSEVYTGDVARRTELPSRACNVRLFFMGIFGILGDPSVESIP
jgi:hypothetical protein